MSIATQVTITCNEPQCVERLIVIGGGDHNAVARHHSWLVDHTDRMPGTHRCPLHRARYEVK